MSRRHVDSTEDAELRAKIDEAKRRLPMPLLLEDLGLGAHAKKTARCPFPGHEDKHPSFSVFMGEDGFWRWSCFAGCGNGDEIMFLITLKGISMTQAIKLYLDMAGFPASRSPKSHEYPESLAFPISPESHESPESPAYPVSLVSPVSNGQAREEALKAFAARNACTKRHTARKRRWKLARDLRALEKGIGRELSTAELMPVFDKWHQLSQPFLDPAKTRDGYMAAFLAELRKVRVPTGERKTLKTALEYVLHLSVSELPVIPEMPQPPESWRRLAALHRELSRLSTNNDKSYFLSYRDAAKASPDLSPQKAHDITLVLERLRVIKIVRVGVAHPSGGKASEFRYLLPTAIQPF